MMNLEWWVILLIIGAILLLFLFSGMPVMFAFLAVNMICFFIWEGGFGSLKLLVTNAMAYIADFQWVAMPAFVLMGEIMFHSGLAKLLIDNVGKWVGRYRGSLSLGGIMAGTLFAMMSGSSISGVALFGSTLAPEMESRGYKKPMIYGPILGAGGLAILIPPSTMTVILATLTQQNVGKLLIASVVPGFVLAAIYVIYILVRCRLQPELAPAFATSKYTWSDRFLGLLTILPLAGIIFVVLGFIFFGVATPAESAAVGATGTFILAALYRKLTWKGLKKGLEYTILATTFTFAIVMSSSAFSQLLAYTGIIRELGTAAVSLHVSSTVIVLMMMVVLTAMGMFMDSISMVMITCPVFYPIIKLLGLNPIWFGIFLLVNQEMAVISPPFGTALFTLKAVVPKASMKDIYQAAVPICLMILVLILLVIFIPPLTLWLPSLMK